MVGWRSVTMTKGAMSKMALVSGILCVVPAARH